MTMTILAGIVLVLSLGLPLWFLRLGQVHNALLFAGFVCIAISSLIDDYTSAGSALAVTAGAVLLIMSIVKRPLQRST